MSCLAFDGVIDRRHARDGALDRASCIGSRKAPLLPSRHALEIFYTADTKEY
jgi:hypothetical protein